MVIFGRVDEAGPRFCGTNFSGGRAIRINARRWCCRINAKSTGRVRGEGPSRLDVVVGAFGGGRGWLVGWLVGCCWLFCLDIKKGVTEHEGGE
jgi:hypothetical protein